MTASAIRPGGRFMASQSVGGASTLSTSGDDDSNTRVTVNGTLFNSATSTSTYNLASGTYAPGAVSGAVNLPVTGEGLTRRGHLCRRAGQFQRQRLAAARGDGLGHQPGSGGRFMASQSVGGASTLATTGDDDSNTRVTVNGTLFNSATSTSTYNLASGTYGLGAVSGAVNLPVTGEGLSGEGPYSDVLVNFSGNALLNRVVTSTSASFGLVHAGAASTRRSRSPPAAATASTPA